jgi:hypothetical protein
MLFDYFSIFKATSNSALNIKEPVNVTDSESENESSLTPLVGDFESNCPTVDQLATLLPDDSSEEGEKETKDIHSKNSLFGAFMAELTESDEGVNNPNSMNNSIIKEESGDTTSISSEENVVDFSECSPTMRVLPKLPRGPDSSSDEDLLFQPRPKSIFNRKIKPSTNASLPPNNVAPIVISSSEPSCDSSDKGCSQNCKETDVRKKLVTRKRAYVLSSSSDDNFQPEIRSNKVKKLSNSNAVDEDEINLRRHQNRLIIASDRSSDGSDDSISDLFDDSEILEQHSLDAFHHEKREKEDNELQILLEQ